MNIPNFPSDKTDNDRQENRLRQEEEADLEPIQEGFRSIEKHGSTTHVMHQKWQETCADRKELRKANPEQAYPKTDQLVTCLMFVIFLMAAYVISLMLIYSSTEYLVSLMARDNKLLSMLGIMLVPLALMAIQLTIGIELHLAKHKSSSTLEATQRMSRVAVLLTPGLILGTFLAETWGGIPWPPEILLLAVRIGLAYITDVLIVSKGDRAFEAKRLLVFWLNHEPLKRREQRQSDSVEKHAGATIYHYQECQQKLASFRAKFPESSFTLPPVSRVTNWVLETWMGPDYTPLK